MRVLWTVIGMFLFAGVALAEKPVSEQKEPAPKEETIQRVKQTAEKGNLPLTDAEQKKQMKARRKQIKKLVKAYKKASADEKKLIKAQLTELVSISVDNGILYMKQRIASERENLDNWEAKVQKEEANLPTIKAQRVEDLLSGEAKKKHKAAKKAWKKQIKEAKKKMK